MYQLYSTYIRIAFRNIHLKLQQHTRRAKCLDFLLFVFYYYYFNIIRKKKLDNRTLQTREILKFLKLLFSWDGFLLIVLHSISQLANVVLDSFGLNFLQKCIITFNHIAFFFLFPENVLCIIIFFSSSGNLFRLTLFIFCFSLISQ